MRIYQVVTSLAYGDAVGNDILALMKGLKRCGYQTKVFAEMIDERISCLDVETISLMKDARKDDIILYHLATGADLNIQIVKYPCRIVLCYHNITPPHFFVPYSEQAVINCEKGLDGVRFLKDKVDYCLLDSYFNLDDLKRMGYKCKMDVVPILTQFEDYKRSPDQSVIREMRDDYVNLLFVGRIAPNKKHEDIIAAYAMYKRHYNAKSRLILAGSHRGMEKYFDCLKSYIEQNSIDDVVFTGHISFEELLAYYQSADAFLCMSEHEGFCVPLIEAMYFNVPIVAYNSTAVGETLGGAGILLDTKKALDVAGVIHHLQTEQDLRQKVIENQKIRLQDFREEKILDNFCGYMKAFIGE